MKALVTGGAGFIGSHVVDRLVFEGYDVSVVDNLMSGSRANVNRGARFYQVDVASVGFERVLRFERPEVVFHQAAQTCAKASRDDPLRDAQVNVSGLVNVLEACVAAGVRKIVFASSAATYGPPLYLPIDENHPQRPASPYGITKLAGEQYIQYYAHARGLQATVLRYATVYGPRQTAHGESAVVAMLAQHLLKGQPPGFQVDGEQVRDFVYVADVALANLLAATAGDGRTFCIGTGIGTSLNQILSMLLDAFRIDAVPRVAPQRASEVRTAYFDPTRAQAELGWAPAVDLKQGLEKTVDFYQRRATVEVGSGSSR